MTTILVIEDHELLRSQITQILELTHFEVIDAADGITGLELARQHRPDLVLCDIILPGVNGFDVLQNLRREPALDMTPFIFLSAKTDRASLRQAMALGADDYLTKPFTTGELLSAVRARLERRDAMKLAAEKDLEHARQQLIHMVTHELRTPMSTINMVVDLLARQLHTLEPAQLYELFDTLDSGSKRLSRLVDQIVLMAQLQAGSLSRRSIFERGIQTPIGELVNGAVKLARRHAYRNADVTIDRIVEAADAPVICNPQALKHALSELILNALHFSPEGRAVTISQWREQEIVYVSVTDHGPGIAPDQLQQALAHFQQLNRDKQEQQGMGLGLALAYHLIDAHGGALALESEAGRGTTAKVALPAAVLKPEPQPHQLSTVLGSTT
ncbi:MAG: response regulator [Chloroflexota bacterium]|nr:MAG: hypothetical protein DIU68_20705 [Chloroflexota bacterium]